MGRVRYSEHVVQFTGHGGEFAVRVEWTGSDPDISGVGDGIERAEGDVQGGLGSEDAAGVYAGWKDRGDVVVHGVAGGRPGGACAVMWRAQGN